MNKSTVVVGIIIFISIILMCVISVISVTQNFDKAKEDIWDNEQVEDNNSDDEQPAKEDKQDELEDNKQNTTTNNEQKPQEKPIEDDNEQLKDNNSDDEQPAKEDKQDELEDNKQNTTTNNEQKPQEKPIVQTVKEYDATSVKANARLLYGKVVTNYTTQDLTLNSELINWGIKWKVLHSNGNNIYLIASDYIPFKLAAKTKKGNPLGGGSEGVDKTVSAGGYVRMDYAGFTDISSKPSVELIQKYYDYIASTGKYPTTDAVKVMAYLLDTDVWSKYANSKFASYAVGSPTLELLAESYNHNYYGNFNVTVNSEFGYTIQDFDKKAFVNKDELYTSSDLRCHLIIASPLEHEYKGIVLATLRETGEFGAMISDSNVGALRPVVCLKSNVKLQETSDGLIIK